MQVRYLISLYVRATARPRAGQEPQVCYRPSGCTDFTQKDIPDRRAGLSFCRPIFGSGDFQGLCAEIMQVEKETPVLGHAVAE